MVELRLDYHLMPRHVQFDPVRWVVGKLIEAGAPVRFKCKKYFARYEESDIELLGNLTRWDDYCTREMVWEWAKQEHDNG